jgi:sensor histidine kinase YesM
MTEDVAVTLLEESEFVKSYLKLENSKSGHPLHITWEIDKNIDASDWKVPAMIIQIPVENALKYAVRNDDEGELIISIKESGESLHLEIRDNGPGYDPAVIAINKGTGTGLKVLLSTINILNKSNKEKINFRIINLKETGNSGTAVQIIVPKDYDFGLTNSPV